MVRLARSSTPADDKNDVNEPTYCVFLLCDVVHAARCRSRPGMTAIFRRELDVVRVDLLVLCGDGVSEGWLANRSSFEARGAHLRGSAATVGNLRLDHERRLVAQICPRWNRLQHWVELVGAFKDAA